MNNGTICVECGTIFIPTWSDVCLNCSGLVCVLCHITNKHANSRHNNKRSFD